MDWKYTKKTSKHKKKREKGERKEQERIASLPMTWQNIIKKGMYQESPKKK